MNLLVVIVTYNAMQWAERCFSSLKNSTVPPDIFVVDNGSTDGTQAFVKEHYPEVMFHQSEKNLGFGKANNMGLQYALDHNYDYVYLLNQDAWVMDDTFERLIEISKEYPEYGILSPFQMNADLMHIDHNFLVGTLAWESNPDILNDMYVKKINEVYQVRDVMAAHWLITRGCIMKIGGFSPSFHHYGEDNNFVDRVHFWGLKVGVTPFLKVVHDRGGREDTKTKKLYLLYMCFIRELSNPNNKFEKAMFCCICSCIRNMINFWSLSPFLSFAKIMRNIFTIKKNRNHSANSGCAFLIQPS